MLEHLRDGVFDFPCRAGVALGRVDIAGLAEPQVETVEGTVVIRAEGFTARFSGAEVQRIEGRLFLTLDSH